MYACGSLKTDPIAGALFHPISDRQDLLQFKERQTLQIPFIELEK